MSEKFEKCLEHVLHFEGGFVDHPEDPGGRTNMGITQKTFDAWRTSMDEPKDDVANITVEEVKEIYKDNYWDKIKGDQLPDAIAVLMMDTAVNSGVSRAGKTLQKAVNDVKGKGSVGVDGKIGPQTIAAAESVPADKLLDAFIIRRGFFYGSLSTFKTFGRGWARRLVASSRKAYGIYDQAKRESEEQAARTSPSGHTSPVKLKNFFFNDPTAQVYGSFFQHWGGWITAGHTIKAMRNRAPTFASGHLIAEPGGLDAGLIGCSLPSSAPPEPKRGQKVIAMGYPAGSPAPAARVCEIVEAHDDKPFWLARILTPDEPVVVGMSGGIVFDELTKEPIGIITHRNNPHDFEPDGKLDQSLNFVSLADVWREANA